jgi:hypothetical protein
MDAMAMGVVSMVMGMAGGMGGNGFAGRAPAYDGYRPYGVSRAYDDHAYGYDRGDRYGRRDGYGYPRPAPRPPGYAAYGGMVCATVRGTCRAEASYRGSSCGCQTAYGGFVPGTLR